MKKVILAYSGGLDTSCCIKWLRDKGFRVVCFSANLGSEYSPSELRRRALRSGADKIYVKDLRREFAYKYILPSLKAGAVYQKKYLLSTALGRPLIAKYLVEVAHKEKAQFVAHGCSAKGNDQVRFEMSIKILNPKLKIIAPLREWGLTCREAEIDYAKKNRLPIKVNKDKPYSIDKNLWGVSIEAGILEDLGNEPQESAFILTKSLEKTPSKPQYIEIEFEKGKPLRLNRKKLDLVSLIQKLNQIGAHQGIGRTDLIEDRIVGIKSREIYEAPAGWILYTALRELENLVLDREVLYFKELVSLTYAQLIYRGLWFSSLRRALDGFIEKIEERATGKITLKLYKGNIIISKRESENSLYKKGLATYGEKDLFNKGWAEGFINIWSLPFTDRRVEI
ncbi:MAG TPA: argininosuccinate synthase [Candidatus Omnitrophica bacterium]|nr:MAG: argininosuccinate synthase [Candidatus Omnitrophota bacterium]RKY35401.1 MAG: argininosuccinate synthase [Candidatus Omnitrophota bacterium]RKY44888.1 MAG: argininosuccinate synthase [Candidatus Omnitrophota bacterium]HEC69328.1 argininosuccinate synthase [Candidatus Omnitrophota bacterium]